MLALTATAYRLQAGFGRLRPCSTRPATGLWELPWLRRPFHQIYNASTAACDEPMNREKRAIPQHFSLLYVRQQGLVSSFSALLIGNVQITLWEKKSEMLLTALWKITLQEQALVYSICCPSATSEWQDIIIRKELLVVTRTSKLGTWILERSNERSGKNSKVNPCTSIQHFISLPKGKEASCSYRWR